MGKVARVRRRPPGGSALLFALAVLAVVWGSVAPHARPAVAAPKGFSDPPAPPPLPWPAESPIVNSEEVGYLAGGGTVTAAGEYQYTVPIEVPDGRAGMAPAIALRYGSRGGRDAGGIAGVGWSLEYGGSEIAPCPKVFALDGKVDTPNGHAGDALCLDGQRLVQIDDGMPWAEGAEYRTWRDSFTKIVAHGGSGEGGAAVWFEAFGKGGRIRVYEPLSAKRLTSSLGMVLPGEPPVAGEPPVGVTAVWVMTSERDRAGNGVLFHHETEPDSEAPYAFEHRISSIEYTARLDEAGKVVEAPRRKVVFEYSLPEERPDPRFSYQNGVRTAVTRRLSRIKLVAPNPVLEDVIGQYALAYEPDQPRSFLTSVVRLDESGWRRMWERRFEWAHDERPRFQVVDPPQLAGTFHEREPVLFDADNDGRTDLLVNGTFCRTTAGSLVPFDACVSGSVTAGLGTRAVDVNGDGKVDLIRKAPDGAVFTTWNGATGAFESLGYGIAAHANLIDADGDGLVDAFVRGPRQNELVDYYDQEWFLRLNTGAGFAEPAAPAFAAPFMIGRKAVALDLDGNGRGELHVGFHPADDPPSECAAHPLPPWDYFAVGLHDSGTLVSNVTLPQGSPCRKVLADLNGDGLQDFVRLSGPDSTVRYNTGTRFLAPEPVGAVVPIFPRLGKHDFEVADIDGDGLDDLVSSHEATVPDGVDHAPSTYLHLRRPYGFQTVDLGAAPYEIPAYDPQDFPPNLENASPLVKVGDVNGDGLADLVALIRDRSMNTSRVRVLLQEWEPHDLVVRVWDEHSPEPRESVFYSPFPTETPSPSNCTYPARCLRGGAVVAREHWIHRQDVPGAIRRTGYEYDDLRSDMRGRGMLGFGKVRTVDLDSFAETVTFFDHATVDDGLYPFAGMPREVWRITPILRTATAADGGVVLPPAGVPITARISRTHHVPERRFTHGGLTHMVFETASRTEEWEQHVALEPEGVALLDDGSATAPRVRHTSRQLDDHGTELFSASWTEGGHRCETTTVPQNDEANWLLGLPASTAVTCQQDGLPLPEARLQTMEHDSRGLLTKVTVEPNHPELSTVTTYARDERGLVHKVTVAAQGEAPRKTFLAYDDEGVYPRATWNALGHYQQQLIHPAFGVRVRTQDPNGVQVRYRHDGFGRVREIDPDDGPATLVSYQQDADIPWALRVVESRADGGASQTVTDEWGRTVGTAVVGFDGQWIHERVGYNRFGQRTEESRPSIEAPPALATVTTYDTLGRPVQIVAPDGATTTIAHSMFEALTTDPEGRQSKIVRDLDDRVAQTADLFEGQWVGMTYHYGPFSQMEDAIDPAGHGVHTGYDKLGRRVLLDDPDRGTTTWTYNAFGEVTSELDALGETTVFARDVLGRVTSTTHPTNGVTTFAYDGTGKPGEIGHLTGAASPDGVTTTQEYDALGRNVRSAWKVGNDEYDLIRTYDEYSRLDTLRYPLVPGRAPFVAEYGYNAHGYTSRVYDATDPAAPEVLWQVDSRTADGLLGQTTTGNGFTETRQYDPATGHLTHIEAVRKGTALYAVHYDRDLAGNIRTRDDYASAAPRTETFTYDDLDRLKSWTVEAEQEQRGTVYGYDLLGNLETITRDGTVETHTHDGVMQGGSLAKPHALTGRTVAGQTSSFGYDARGRQLHGAGREITWKPFDLPAQIGAAGQVTTFSYDAAGRRVRKVRTAGGALVEQTDTIAGLYERRWTPNAPPQHVFYVRGTDGPVAQVVYAEGAAGAGQTLYLHREALGSVGLVTDSQGGEVERTYFDPFGEKTDALGEGSSPLLGAVKLGFTGHRHDDELALVDMKGRVYDPAQKRFLTPDIYVPDPLSSQSYNRYSYVANNPLRYTDPTGFLPSPADHKAKGSTQPDGGTAAPAPAPSILCGLVAPVTLIRAKADDTGNTPPPQPSPGERAEQEGKWAELMKHMAWGAARQLLSSAPPVVAARNIQHNFQLAASAVRSAREGDWGQAFSTLLEMPEKTALGAARSLIAPIEAALSIPASVQTAMNPEADPEMRGAAMVQGAQAVITVVAAVVGAAAAVKGSVGDLRSAGQKDAHHVIQDAAVRDLPGYETNAAPGVQLPRSFKPSRYAALPSHAGPAATRGWHVRRREANRLQGSTQSRPVR